MATTVALQVSLSTDQAAGLIGILRLQREEMVRFHSTATLARDTATAREFARAIGIADDLIATFETALTEVAVAELALRSGTGAGARGAGAN